MLMSKSVLDTHFRRQPLAHSETDRPVPDLPGPLRTGPNYSDLTPYTSKSRSSDNRTWKVSSGFLCGYGYGYQRHDPTAYFIQIK